MRSPETSDRFARRARHPCFRAQLGGPCFFAFINRRVAVPTRSQIASPTCPLALFWRRSRLLKVRYPAFIGALGGIRTPDPQIRSLVLYPAELRAPTRLLAKTPPNSKWLRTVGPPPATATANPTHAPVEFPPGPARSRSASRAAARGGRRLPCYGPASQAAEEPQWPSPTFHPLPSSSA